MEPRLRIEDIFGLLDSLGDNQWETLEQYQLHNIEIDKYDSPLAKYLEKRYAGSMIDIDLVRFESPTQKGGKYNAVYLLDKTYDKEIVVKLPYHVMFVEDYIEDMLDSGPATQDEEEYVEQMKAEAADRDYTPFEVLPGGKQ